MAFDPQREDYQRLGLRFAQSLDMTDPAQATHAFASFGRRFAQDRDSLPQADSDRAFHLVVRASKLIDYELPFANDDRAAQIIEEGHRILDEAVMLDRHCYDAIRMKAAATNPSFDAFLRFLNDRSSEVRAYCEEQRASITADQPGERASLLADLCMRPYFRWVSKQAEEALICGRNREALRLAHQLMELDPKDKADVRFTAAYALAKLEDESGLETLARTVRTAGSTRPADDAWMLIARMSLAFKRHELATATNIVDDLVDRYPHAAEVLIRQHELPDGVFARLPAIPYSEDELIIAVSEATVLLQEGIDPQGRGILGTWVMQQTAQRYPHAMLQVMAQQAQDEEREAEQ